MLLQGLEVCILVFCADGVGAILGLESRVAVDRLVLHEGSASGEQQSCLILKLTCLRSCLDVLQ